MIAEVVEEHSQSVDAMEDYTIRDQHSEFTVLQEDKYYSADLSQIS